MLPVVSANNDARLRGNSDSIKRFRFGVLNRMSAPTATLHRIALPKDYIVTAPDWRPIHDALLSACYWPSR